MSFQTFMKGPHTFFLLILHASITFNGPITIPHFDSF